MNVKITPSTLTGVITAPASKSFAHRLIIGAFLSNDEVKVHGVGSSKDVAATLSALTAMGADVSLDEGCVSFRKRKPFNGEITANCHESGSTLRFLFPIAGALGIDVDFTGSPRLMERPMDALTSCLTQHGVQISGHRTSGRLTPGLYVIDAGVSSQFITGLLFALTLLDRNSQVFLRGGLVSRGYLDITVRVLKSFGVRVDRTDYGYFVFGNQKYEAKASLDVEGDWSGAAFLLTAGAIGGEVEVKGLNTDSVQGDRAILDVLSRLGARVTFSKASAKVSKGELRAIEYDCEDIPDLVQAISVACAYARGESVLKNVDRLRIKESDRVEAIIDMLTRAGIRAWVDGHDLHVVGGAPRGATFDGGNDHRTVMSEAVLASFADGESQILGAEVVDKSYPDFFRDLIALGGRVNG